MSKFYTEKHRALQEKFDMRRTADLLENVAVHSEFAAHEAEFIQSRDMFFLSTVDASGRPTVSYKGGAPGFVRVTSASSLLFPNYDGNGMYYSIGNIMCAPHIGLLFIDFETPNRLRVQGAAEVQFDHPLLEIYPGAQFLIAVAVEFDLGQLSALHPSAPQTRAVEILSHSWPGTAFACMETDRYRAGGTAKDDRKRVPGAGGEITMDAYAELVAKGEA